MRSALVHLVKSCPPSHSSDQRFASCNCKVFDGQWPDSGSRFGERKASKVWSCVHNVVVAENCIRISWHLPHSQVAGEWDVYIDIYGRKLMEKSVDIGQMVGVPFPNECHHLLKDFLALVENCLLPTGGSIQSRGDFGICCSRSPQGPCSPVCHRRCRPSCRGRLAACTCQSPRCVCGPRSPAGGCPA